MFDSRVLDLSALKEVAPGPDLAAVLAGIDPTMLNGYARVIVMQAWQRQSSWASCQMYDVMTLVARSPECMVDSAPELTKHFTEFASAEIGAALTMSPGSADRELSFAYELTERLPGTRAALDAGRIDLAKAKEIAAETASLSPELALQAEAFILPLAPGLTKQQISRRLRAKVLALDPDGAEERRRRTTEERRVRFGTGCEGTGEIGGYQLPLEGVAAAEAFVKAVAKAIHDEADGERTLTQIEADVYLNLLQGHHLDTHGVVPKVELVAPLETWLRLAADCRVAGEATADHDAPARDDGPADHADAADNDPATSNPAVSDPPTSGCAPTSAGSAGSAGRAGREPGELVGFGPVPAEVLAEIMKAAHAGFEYSHTATHDGAVVVHGRGAYRPTKAQQEFVRARDRTCRQPGCLRPGKRCDADHTMEHRLGGPTCVCNLATLCRRHHRAKHEGRWWWIQPEQGVFRVRSPLGHRYERRPDPVPGGGERHVG
ncbi:DUF222 domain-containing protein [Actinopolymorpha sp. B9G3]|uniref:HNH endonuclease n=1 Tax=Actinopolymorpha sp. B9G3 TaxID=3158970 RepID=UPI0032D91938